MEGIYEKKPDVIGFSCYLWNIEYVNAIACDLKKIMPETVLIAGGPEVTYSPVSFLKEHDYFDIIMTGEGETSFYEYVKSAVKGEGAVSVRLSDIAGIVYRDDRGIHQNAPRPPVSMDELIFPYTDEDMKQLEHRIVYYESMRGCPFSCSYCLSSIDKTVRLKSVKETGRDGRDILQHFAVSGFDGISYELF